MRRRVLQATITAVLVSLLILGIPLALIGGGFIRSNELRDIENRAIALSRAVDNRITRGEPITQDILESYVDGGVPAHVIVITPDGQTFSAGPVPSGNTHETTHASGQNALIQLVVANSTLVWKSVQVVALVMLAAIGALGVGIVIAIWQANRLSAPLVYLAASAEQLGSGQVRPHVEESGVEEIDLVTAELSRSADRLANRLAIERQFAADASHQLRTPLTALSMRLEEIMIVSDQGEVREEARVSLEQVERLVHVVDDLLTRSRQHGTGTAERVALREIADQQFEEWGPTFEQAGRELVFDIAPDMYVLATAGPLSQVLATLIENSLKHGGGRTTVSSRPGGTRGSVAIDVADEGAGVPADLALHIFERNVTSGDGTGLGLALARDLVAADGGRLELSQRSPAVFTIFLPGILRMIDPAKVVPHGASVDPVTRSGWGRRGSHQR